MSLEAKEQIAKIEENANKIPCPDILFHINRKYRELQDSLNKK